MKNTLLFTYSTNILVRLLTANMNNCLTQKSENVRSHSCNSVENATPSSGTSPSASYKEVTPPPPSTRKAYVFCLALKNGFKQNTHKKMELKTLYFNSVTGYNYKTVFSVLSRGED